MSTERRNLWLAVAAVALGQAAVLGYMIWDRVSLLSHGREIVLEVIPVDPRSLFRGDYVVLGYDVSRLDLPPGAEPPPVGSTYYVTLKKSQGDTWQLVGGGAAAPSGTTPDEVVLKGRVEYAAKATPERPAQVGIHYGIESFFVPEGTGRELEKMVGEKKLSALIAVDENGKAAIKGLLSEGKRVYEEPLL